MQSVRLRNKNAINKVRNNLNSLHNDINQLASRQELTTSFHGSNIDDHDSIKKLVRFIDESEKEPKSEDNSFIHRDIEILANHLRPLSGIFPNIIIPESKSHSSVQVYNGTDVHNKILHLSDKLRPYSNSHELENYFPGNMDLDEPFESIESSSLRSSDESIDLTDPFSMEFDSVMEETEVSLNNSFRDSVNLEKLFSVSSEVDDSENKKLRASVNLSVSSGISGDSHGSYEIPTNSSYDTKNYGLYLTKNNIVKRDNVDVAKKQNLLDKCPENNSEEHVSNKKEIGNYNDEKNYEYMKSDLPSGIIVLSSESSSNASLTEDVLQSSCIESKSDFSNNVKNEKDSKQLNITSIQNEGQKSDDETSDLKNGQVIIIQECPTSSSNINNSVVFDIDSKNCTTKLLEVKTSEDENNIFITPQNKMPLQAEKDSEKSIKSSYNQVSENNSEQQQKLVNTSQIENRSSNKQMELLDNIKKDIEDKPSNIPIKTEDIKQQNEKDKINNFNVDNMNTIAISDKSELDISKNYINLPEIDANDQNVLNDCDETNDKKSFKKIELPPPSLLNKLEIKTAKSLMSPPPVPPSTPLDNTNPIKGFINMKTIAENLSAIEICEEEKSSKRLNIQENIKTHNVDYSNSSNKNPNASFNPTKCAILKSESTVIVNIDTKHVPDLDKENSIKKVIVSTKSSSIYDKLAENSRAAFNSRRAVFEKTPNKDGQISTNPSTPKKPSKNKVLNRWNNCLSGSDFNKHEPNIKKEPINISKNVKTQIIEFGKSEKSILMASKDKSVTFILPNSPKSPGNKLMSPPPPIPITPKTNDIDCVGVITLDGDEGDMKSKAQKSGPTFEERRERELDDIMATLNLTVQLMEDDCEKYCNEVVDKNNNYGPSESDFVSPPLPPPPSEEDLLDAGSSNPPSGRASVLSSSSQNGEISSFSPSYRSTQSPAVWSPPSQVSKTVEVKQTPLYVTNSQKSSVQHSYAKSWNPGEGGKTFKSVSKPVLKFLGNINPYFRLTLEEKPANYFNLFNFNCNNNNNNYKGGKTMDVKRVFVGDHKDSQDDTHHYRSSVLFMVNSPETTTNTWKTSSHEKHVQFEPPTNLEAQQIFLNDFYSSPNSSLPVHLSSFQYKPLLRDTRHILIKSNPSEDNSRGELTSTTKYTLPQGKNFPTPTADNIQVTPKEHLPKGAVYETKTIEDNKVHTDTYYPVENGDKTVYERTKTTKVILAPHYQGIGPTDDKGVPIALRSTVDDQKKWYKNMFKQIHNNDARESPVGDKPSTDATKYYGITNDNSSNEDARNKNRSNNVETKVRNTGRITNYTPSSPYVAENKPEKFEVQKYKSHHPFQPSKSAKPPSDFVSHNPTTSNKTIARSLLDLEYGLTSNDNDPIPQASTSYHLQKNAHADLEEEETKLKEASKFDDIHMPKFFRKSVTENTHNSKPATEKSTKPVLKIEATMERPEQAVAKYNFTPQTQKEMALKKGQTVIIKNTVDENWFLGETTDGKYSGIFPVAYVEITATKKTRRRGLAKAKFQFNAQIPTQLSFEKGQEIVLTDKIDDNWYKGIVGSRSGILPANYIEVRSEPENAKKESNINFIKPTNTSSSTTYKTPPKQADNAPRSPVFESATDDPDEKLRMNKASYLANTIANTEHRLQPASHNRNHSDFDMTEIDQIVAGIDVTDAQPIQQNGNSNTNGVIQQQDNKTATNLTEAHVALYTYQPLNDDELELIAGDNVVVLEKCDDGWFVGTNERTGAFGTFPGNYVIQKQTL